MGRSRNAVTAIRYLVLGSTSPVYTPLDFIKAALGTARSYSPLLDDIYAADLFHEVPRIEVPVWFLMSRHDTVVSDAVLARYFRALEAPRGKKLIWFEHSAHAPHLEEPAKYRAVITQIARGEEHTPAAGRHVIGLFRSSSRSATGGLRSQPPDPPRAPAAWSREAAALRCLATPR